LNFKPSSSAASYRELSWQKELLFRSSIKKDYFNRSWEKHRIHCTVLCWRLFHANGNNSISTFKSLLPCWLSLSRGILAVPCSKLGAGRSWLKFLVGFFSHSRETSWLYLKIGHGHFLSHYFQYTVHWRAIIRDSVIWATETIAESKWVKLM
jgi:hypothetical protein